MVRVLITCFMPFRGRAKNSSQVLARYLKTHHQVDEILIVNIPVRWGAVESTTSSAIKNWQPDVILGLGEGSDGIIAFETIGRNLRCGEDVDGIPPSTEYILKNGEAERRGSFSLYWTDQIHLPVPLKISLDAGAYLCNNALYYTAVMESIRVGFIHVPPQGDTDDEEYCILCGPVLLEILRQNTSLRTT